MPASKNYAHTSGDSSKPLVLAYHGFTQKVHGWVVKFPWRRNFLHNSGLLTTCEELGWSCYMPQARNTNWAAGDHRNAAMHITKARAVTKSKGPLLIFGFSDGGTLAHMAARHLWCYEERELYKPTGVWVHSGLFPTMLTCGSGIDAYKVALTCNEGETRALPFNNGKSMQDERLEAHDWYLSRYTRIKTLEGSGSKHSCDPKLNKPTLKWLAA